MAYVTAQQVIDAVGESNLRTIVNVDDPRAPLNEARITSAIAEVESEINGYISKVANVPLVTVPPMVERAVIILTHETLYTSNPKMARPQNVDTDAKRVRAMLKDIASGVLSLDTTTVGTTPAASIIKTNKTSDDRMFPEDFLALYE